MVHVHIHVQQQYMYIHVYILLSLFGLLFQEHSGSVVRQVLTLGLCVCTLVSCWEWGLTWQSWGEWDQEYSQRMWVSSWSVYYNLSWVDEYAISSVNMELDADNVWLCVRYKLSVCLCISVWEHETTNKTYFKLKWYPENWPKPAVDWAIRPGGRLLHGPLACLISAHSHGAA